MHDCCGTRALIFLGLRPILQKNVLLLLRYFNVLKTRVLKNVMGKELFCSLVPQNAIRRFSAAD